MILALAAVLVAVALLAGVGITTVGPGGVFVTAALYGLTDLSSAAVAGTASATFVATGIVGSGAYVRSGELAASRARDAAVILSASAIVGALAGARANFAISDRAFGYLLGAFLAFVGILVAYRELVGVDHGNSLDAGTTTRRGVFAAVGLGVGFLGGMLGVGGPVVAVPLLVVLGMPMLRAVAVAQVQSIFLSLFAALGYLAAGAVDPVLAVLVGVPQVVGVVAGWRVAHLVEPRRLRLALSVVLVAVAPVVAL